MQISSKAKTKKLFVSGNPTDPNFKCRNLVYFQGLPTLILFIDK